MAATTPLNRSRLAVSNRPAARRSRRRADLSPAQFALRIGAAALFAVILRAGLAQAVPSAASRLMFSPMTAGGIAPMFSPEIHYWANDIVRWAQIYGGGLDPDLVATVMQIESCGHADISSPAGAQGLFQVMPFHFHTGEVMTDPETNARRGVGYLAQCWEMADQDVGRTMACYNGGPSVLRRPFQRWAWETQRYYVYGATIFADAQANMTRSPSLDYWLNVGGAGLCTLAAQNQRTRRLPQVG